MPLSGSSTLHGVNPNLKRERERETERETERDRDLPCSKNAKKTAPKNI